MGNDKYNQDRAKNPYRVSKEPEPEPTPESFAKPGVDFETQRICVSC